MVCRKGFTDGFRRIVESCIEPNGSILTSVATDQSHGAVWPPQRAEKMARKYGFGWAELQGKRHSVS
eukprot:253837-Pyramimonas_sp.AAC.1